MKLTRIFAALAASTALLASCAKEVPVSEQDIVSEGMKRVSFELGIDTKISGNPAKWNSKAEKVAVIGKRNGETYVYEFQSEGPGSSQLKNTISGEVHNDATLYCVVFPYKTTYDITVSEGELQSISLPDDFKSMAYATSDGVSSTMPFACKLKYESGEYTPKTDLQPLFASLKITLPERATDAATGKTAKPTPYISKIQIEGLNITGASTVDFSGDTPVTTRSDAESNGTITVTTKTNTTSGMPSDGAYIVHILPGTYSSLKFTAIYTATSSGVQYADYTATYTGSNTLTQGTYKSLTLSGPYVTSASVSSAELDGTTLMMSGSSDILMVGKLSAADYGFAFKYREKGEENYTSVDAVYADGEFTANATVTAGKTYEVIAVVSAKNALKDGDGTKDLVVESSSVDSGTYIAPVVLTIDKFGTKAYGNGGNWKYTGSDASYTNFAVKDYCRIAKEDTYDYYASSTDTTSLVSGVVLYATGTNGYYFSTTVLFLYAGWIQIPGKVGYKITKASVKVYSSGNADGTIGIYDEGETTKIGTTNGYVGPKTQETLTATCEGVNDHGVRIKTGQTWRFYEISVTYTKY